MAADPFAFYRGSACLFYADVTRSADDWADDRTSRVWIHGDLHAQNFGTYMNSHGRLVFDVNDFDEAYIGHFSWDLRRFVASLALMGWQKALPEDAVRRLIGRYLRAYLAQVSHYASTAEDDDFALHLENTDGPVLEVLSTARTASRVDLLDSMTRFERQVRVFDEDASIRRLGQGRARARWRPRSRATCRPSRSPRSSTASCSTRSATWSASRASASAAPACRRTTCWWRATASPSTTTWCCR